MERATLAYWALVLGLLGGAGFYGNEVRRFQAAQQPKDAALASGDVVTLKTVLDGDTLIVAKADGGLATVRLLGIKAFEAKLAKDDSAVHGRAAEEALRRLASDQPLRVLLNTPPKDRHGPWPRCTWALTTWARRWWRAATRWPTPCTPSPRCPPTCRRRTPPARSGWACGPTPAWWSAPRA
jgi:endonuclease YncB( thermonuclease family)